MSRYLLSFKKGEGENIFACIDSKSSGYLGIETVSCRLQGIARMGRVEI